MQAGSVVRVRRGLYRPGALGGALDIALAATAVLSHRSAALHHGWEVATAPELPEVIVRRNRRLRPAQLETVTARHRDLDPSEVEDGVTTPLRTVLDCARDLPLPEALAVADSALRHKAVSIDQLRAAAHKLRGPGSARAAQVARAASRLAANPFESTLRALALQAGLNVAPQVQVAEVGLYARVDLADEDRRLVVEAESFQHHGHRRGFRKDVRRYSRLVVYGWTVLRFVWEDVMLEPDYVLWALRSWRLAHDRGIQVGHPPRRLQRLA